MSEPTRVQADTWQGTEPLPVGKAVLLEASAGTGKTWQIAHLVARLVVLECIPVHELLVITFTKAATAELRDRIRRRLVAVRDVLERDAEPQPGDPGMDPMLLWFWTVPRQESELEPADRADAADAAALRGARAARAQQALSAFDRAGISTIHGFSQRTLEQLAFESGQEPDLEVVADAAEICEAYVADLMATAYAAATEEETRVLTALGFVPDRLRKLVKTMTGAATPQLRPAPATLADLPDDPVALARRWIDAMDGQRADLNAGKFDAAFKALPDLKGKGERRSARRARARSRPFRRGSAGPGRARPSAPTHSSGICGASRCPRPRRTADTRPPRRCSRRSTTPSICASGSTAALAICVASRARAHVEAELLRRRQLTYDAMLSRLADRVEGQGAAGRSPRRCALDSRWRSWTSSRTRTRPSGP